MPRRNTVKSFAEDQYYHVYSRGVAKQPIFLDNQDYGYFLSLFKRYLSNKSEVNSARMEYPHYSGRLELIAFCLIGNHFHLLIYQHDSAAMTEFMRSLITSYSMYFNKRYRRFGPVFQSAYKASLVDQASYLEHISRYIHLNPDEWSIYEYSSLPYFINKKSAEWIKPERIMGMFNNPAEYWRFLNDYEDHKKMLDEIKWELAD